MKLRQLINAALSMRVPGAIFGLALLGTLSACSGSQQRALDLAGQADALLKEGRLLEARKTIDAAIRERDDVAAIYLEKGRIELADKSPVEAFRAYSEALALDATSVEALQAISQLGLVLGATDDAEKAVDRILVLQPGEPNALLIKGLISLNRHKPDDAGKFADQILAANAIDERGLILKARVLFSQGETGKALAVLQLVSTPSVAVSLTLLELHRAAEDPAAMLRDFAVLVALRPADLRQVIDEANVRYKTGDKSAARARLAKLIERPDVTPEDMRRVVTLWQQYDPDPIPLQSVGGAPQFRTDGARRAVVRFYLDAGMPQKALALLGAAKSTEDLGLHARAAAMLGQTKAAADQVATILNDDGTQCDALLARAWSSRIAGLARKAVIDAQQVVSECPQEPGGYIELARDFQALGDRQGEFRTFDSALAAMPQNPMVARSYFDRAIAAGDGARAVSVARRVTRFAPSLMQGWTLLGDACRRTSDASCADDAASGLKRAATAFVLDPLPGERPARELFSRLDR